jgi:hypothetical protein
MQYNAFPRDHHAIWCDITFNPEPLAPPQLQSLNLNHPPTVQKYRSILTKQRLMHHLPSQLETLYKSILQNPAGCPITPEQQAEAYHIDNLDTQAMLYAVKKCQKSFMGGVDFSPRINDLQNKIAFWSLSLK